MIRAHTLVTALVLLVARPTPWASAQGIQPLTQESYERALKATMEDVATVSSPITIKLLASSTSGDRAAIDEALALAKNAPFSVMVVSPYVRVATAAAEARRKFDSPPPMSIDDVNKQGLVIEVSAGSSFLTADAIETVVLKRGEMITRPLKVSVQPEAIENRMGAKREVARGRFTFAMDAFAPTSPLTIVLVGKAGNFEISMTVAELAQLR